MRALGLAVFVLAASAIAAPAQALDRAAGCDLTAFKQSVREEIDRLRAGMDDPKKIVVTGRDGRIVLVNVDDLEIFIKLARTGTIRQPGQIDALRLLYPDEFQFIELFGHSFTSLTGAKADRFLEDLPGFRRGIAIYRPVVLARIDDLNTLITAADEVCASTPPPPVVTGPTTPEGVWRTSFGEMTFRADGGGTYTEDGGRIEGRLAGGRYDGYWGENNSARYCQGERMGTHHWGRLQLDFNSAMDEFKGTYSYCDEAVGAPGLWNGTLIRRGP